MYTKCMCMHFFSSWEILHSHSKQQKQQTNEWTNNIIHFTSFTILSFKNHKRWLFFAVLFVCLFVFFNCAKYNCVLEYNSMTSKCLFTRFQILKSVSNIKQVEKPVLWRTKKHKNYFYIFECKRFVNNFCLVNNNNNAQNGFSFLWKWMQLGILPNRIVCAHY